MTVFAFTAAWVTVIGAGAFLFRPHTQIARAAANLPHVRVTIPVAAVVSLGLVIVRWPWAAPLAVVAAAVLAPIGSMRSRRQVDRRVGTELPEVIDLLRVCAEGGMTVRLSLETVAELSPAVITAHLSSAIRAATAGAALGDSLDDCTVGLGPLVRPLVSVLTASERYGVPIVASLDRLSAEARAEERRRGEAAARKVPVRLLFPLVLCILPAFALLTVAPLIAGGLESLRLP